MPESPTPNQGAAAGDAPMSSGATDSPEEPKNNGPAPNAQIPSGQPAPAPVAAGTAAGRATPAGSLTAGWLGYKALDNVAAELADRIPVPEGNKPLIITVGDDAVVGLQAWRNLTAVSESVKSAIDDIIGAPAPKPESAELAALTAAITTINGALSAVSGLFALFKTTVKVAEHAITFDEHAVVAATAGALLSKNSNLKIKTSESLAVAEGAKSLAIETRGLIKARGRADEALADMGEDNPKNAHLKALTSALDQLLEKSPALKSGPVADAVAGGARLAAELADGAKLLNLKPVLGGGDSLTINRSFFHREEIHINGVCVMSYLLYGTDGILDVAGSCRAHTGYTGYGNLQKEFWSAANRQSLRSPTK